MAAEQKKRNTLWWTVDGDTHRNVFDTVSSIHNNSRERIDRNLRCMRLYGNADVLNFGATTYLNAQAAPTLPDNRVKLNIISAMVDTVGSRISKMKPRVTFLTEGGNSTSQKQAKQLTKFMTGAFYMNDIHKLHQQGFRDGEITDLGAIKHYIDNGKICSERVLCFELYTDPMDALYGMPRSLYQVKYIPKTVLAQIWDDKKNQAAIKQSKEMIDRYIVSENFTEDFVCVIEAWHLPSAEGADDGRHVICLPNHTLVDEEYKKDYFPFTFFRWSDPVVGFWGQSLADRLTSIQVEINKMIRIIQRSFHLGAAFKVFLEYGSKVSKEHINNDIGSIIYYLGQKPEFYTPSVVHQEYFNHLRFLIQSAYEEAGISQLSAGSKKPEGLDSGKALREYNDIETERFALTAQAYEASFLTTARIYVDLANEIGGGFQVKAQSKDFIETIKWKDVAPADSNAFILQMFPTSMLPHEPAGRLAFVQEMINSGMVPPDFGLELLDFPDTQSYMSLKTAAIRDIMSIIDTLAEKDYVSPEPFSDLKNGIPMVQSAYLRFKLEGLKEAKLENFRRWLSAATQLMNKATANASPNPALNPALGGAQPQQQGAPASSMAQQTMPAQ